MPSFILLIIIYSIFVSFVSSVPIGAATNPLFSYYYIQIQFIRSHILLFSTIFFVLTLLFIFLSIQKRQKFIKSYLRFAQRFIVGLITGTLIAFFLLFIIALAEMNILSLLTHISPKVLGVESNSEIIVNRLKKVESVPMVVADNEKDDVLLPTIALAQSGKDTFYGSKIIPHVPTSMVIPIRKTGEGVLMVGNTVIVSRINSSDFQTVSPILSHLFISSYFSRRNVKSYPEVKLMNKMEYQRFREKDFKRKIEVLDSVVGELEDSTTRLNDTISQQEEQLQVDRQDLEQAKEQREKEYISCVNEGYYEDDDFIKVNTEEDCQERVSDLRERVDELETEVEEKASSLESNQQKLEQYQAYIKYYNSQKSLTQESSSFISYEFAAFEPPDKIKLALTSQTSTQALADYFELLIHEYLHYATYEEEGEQLTSDFFTEGLTEFFARNIVRSNLGVETNLGYPANVRIIEQLNKRVSDSDLADIYFSNDQERLEKVLNLAYGEGFYEKNQILLETLHYSSNSNQILNIANDIMNDIGGEPLTKEDLETTYSTFR